MSHIDGTLAFVDAVSQNNTQQQALLMQQGYDQAGKFADALAQGMLMEKPSLYK